MLALVDPQLFESLTIKSLELVVAAAAEDGYEGLTLLINIAVLLLPEPATKALWLPSDSKDEGKPFMKSLVLLLLPTPSPVEGGAVPLSK